MNNINKTALIGLIFVGIGTILLLDNLRAIPWEWKYYIFRWENILIAIGAVLLISRQHIRAGTILVGIGILFSLDDWFYMDIDFWDLWPLVFVVLGIYIIARNQSIGQGYVPRESAVDPDRIEDVAIFGGGDRVIKSEHLKGGHLTAIFGGSNIDLTASRLAEGTNVIDVFYMFGGSKIRVPQDWKVHVNVTGIFGGMSDKRTLVDTDKDPEGELYIKGIAIFGGAEVTN